MTQQEFSDDFKAILDVAHRLADHNEADAVLVMLEGPTDWQQLLASVTNHKLIPNQLKCVHCYYDCYYYGDVVYHSLYGH